MAEDAAGNKAGRSPLRSSEARTFDQSAKSIFKILVVLATTMGVVALFYVTFSVSQRETVSADELFELTPSAFLPAALRLEPTPTPTLSPSSVDAFLAVTANGGLNASTFTPASFSLVNRENHANKIVQITVDLRSAMLPDMVFDPNGEAGDQIAKDLHIDSGASVVGFQGHSYSSPHHDGYDIVHLNFTDFDPGEQVTFSVDVDPTSIRGAQAPGPNDSGSVSGLELTGSVITTSFSNGLTITSNTFRTPNSLSGSEAMIREGLPAKPEASVLGSMNLPATVSDPEQVVRLTGPAWASVTLLVAEAGLFTAGLPGGGFEIEPYEANSVVSIRQYAAVVDGSGTVDVPIMLTRSSPQTGLNHIVAAFENSHGMRGRTSNVIVLQLK